LRDKLRSGNGADDGTEVRRLDIGTIQGLVAKEWGVTPDGLKSKTRTKTLTTPRQVGMYLVREFLGSPLVEIGTAFGGRDHSTVIHSIERVTEVLSTDPAFAKRVEKIRNTLQSLR
jgi:chromosomal replication initiator protein